MTDWFVYSDATYYPSAGIIQADTTEQAIAAYWNSNPQTGLVAFPLDALAHANPADGKTHEDILTALRNDGHPDA